MEKDFMLMTCKRCGKKVLMSNMRLAKDGVSMVCLSCIQNEVQLRDPKVALAKLEAKKPGKKEPMIKWYCQECKYHFERKVGAEVKKCPYCGRGDAIVPETKLASDKIIEESTSSRFDTPDSMLKRR